MSGSVPQNEWSLRVGYSLRAGVLRLRSSPWLACVILGFSSGLPLFVLLSLVQAWQKDKGVDLQTIGLFALAQMPYTWKFLWAPLMDRYAISSIPLGRRQGWILATQIVVMLLIISMGQMDPLSHVFWVPLCALGLAFFSASQDIVIDAWRREILSDQQQGLGVVLHVNAYKIAGLVPGSLSLILADYLSWDWVFLCTGLFMLPGIFLTLWFNAPLVKDLPPRTLADAVWQPWASFRDLHGLKGALLILLFMLLYKLGDSLATALATAFYLDLGYTRTEIGLVAKNAGLWASVLGGIVGGVWMFRLSIVSALWWFGIAQAIAILGFPLLALSPHNLWLLGGVIAVEAFGVGLGTSALTGFMAILTDRRYAATQLALFTSLVAMPRTLINSVAGFLVNELGWVLFFELCLILTIPGLLLLWTIRSNPHLKGSN